MLTPYVPAWVRVVSEVVFYAALVIGLSLAIGGIAAAYALHQSEQVEEQADVSDSWDTAAPHLDVSNIRRLEETSR